MNRYVLRAVRALSGPASAPVVNAWSNPATWAGMGGLPPQAGDAITIGAGTTYTLDTLTNSLGQITINGTLIVSSRVDTTLIADRITIGMGGRYVSGAPGSTNQRRHRITPTEHPLAGVIRGASFGGSDGNTSTGNLPTDCRGLIVMPGGSLEIYGYVPPVTKTFIQGHHYAGAKTITLADDVSASWLPGDEIAIFPTGFYRPDRRTETFTIQSVSGNTVTLASSTGLGFDRWGLLQYMTNTGLSLTPGTYTLSSAGGKKADASMHDVLDQRARVVLLSRRHRMDSPEDAEKLTLGHGHQLMTMNNPGDGGKTFVVGLESKRGGQQGRLGAYPFHCHANSIGKVDSNPSTPYTTNLGALADGQVEFHDCTVNGSFNRAFTYHACQNVKNYNFTSVGTLGHAVFFESGAEINNLLYGSDIAKVSSPSNNIINSDYTNSGGYDSSGPAGLWVTNLYNRFRGNRCADAQHGAWISISRRYAEQATMPTDSVGGCFGIARQIAIYPHYCPPLEWADNVFHSNRFLGKQFQANALNEKQDFDASARSYDPNTQLVPGGSGFINPTFDGDVVWKNNYAGYHNGVAHPLYTRQLFSDNGAGQATYQANGDALYISGSNTPLPANQAASYANDNKTEIAGGYKQHGVGNDFAGVVMGGGVGDRVTFVDTSLNNWDAPTEPNRQRIAFDSYHYTLTFKNISAFGYETNSPPMFEAGFRNVVKTRSVNGSWDFYLDGYEAASRGMVNWNHISNGPMLYMGPGANISDQLPYVNWVPSGKAGDGPQSPKKHSFAPTIVDWWGTLFGQGAQRYGSPDIPFMTYDDPNATPVFAADGGVLGQMTTSTMQVGIHAGFTTWFDSANNDLGGQDMLFQRCAVADFSDYLTNDGLGRKAQWPLMGYYGHGDTESIDQWVSAGGGPADVTFPVGSVVRMYYPSTPTDVARFDRTGGGIVFTRAVGGEWFVYGMPMDVTKNISGGFNGTNFTISANLAALKASSVPTIWKDPTARTGAPHGTAWAKIVLPAMDANGTENKPWVIDLPIYIAAT